MERRYRQCERSRFYAATDNDLSFIGETLVGLVLWRQLGGDYFLEDSLFGVVVFDLLAAERARYQIPLILYVCQMEILQSCLIENMGPTYSMFNDMWNGEYRQAVHIPA